MTGKVIKWIDRLGYGFIGNPGGRDIYVHASQINQKSGGRKSLSELRGQRLWEGR